MIHIDTKSRVTGVRIRAQPLRDITAAAAFVPFAQQYPAGRRRGLPLRPIAAYAAIQPGCRRPTQSAACS
ncbi:hypothetical protein WK57_30230 [Burkholderia ubonensis]|uniref:Uncharacterized protein n=1 Tax=Burkholderia ubonensis TaxID=101571 RepID=A0AA40R512_9BURK|nr:hypothetical protein WK57_30230 [Burkholderia ubonensis]